MERCFCMALRCRSGRVKLYLEYCALFVLQESANHASRTTYRAFRYANRPTWNKSTKSTIRVCDGPMDSLCTRRFGGPSCRKDTDRSWQRLDPRWNHDSDESDPFLFSISRQTSPNSNQTKRIRPFCTRFLIRPMFRSSRAAKFASDHRQENMSVLEQPESFLSFLNSAATLSLKLL